MWWARPHGPFSAADLPYWATSGETMQEKLNQRSGLETGKLALPTPAFD